MSFKAWFRQWRRSIYKVFMLGTKKRKSESQRKKERERRLKAKYSSSARYFKKKRRERRRSSHNVQNRRIIEALFSFTAFSLGIIFLPIGLIHWGYKSAKGKRASRASRTNNNTGGDAKKTAAPRSKPTVETKNKVPTAEYEKNSSTDEIKSVVREDSPTPITPVSVPKEKAHENDDEQPISTPRNEGDKFIRKRMIIAGSSYCDKDILSRLSIGSYLELALEADNPHDKNAVKLLLDGEKVGYVPKNESSAFSTCLKFGRKIYAVITDITYDEFPAKYEFEAWFDCL